MRKHFTNFELKNDRIELESLVSIQKGQYRD